MFQILVRMKDWEKFLNRSKNIPKMALQSQVCFIHTENCMWDGLTVAGCQASMEAMNVSLTSSTKQRIEKYNWKLLEVEVGAGSDYSPSTVTDKTVQQNKLT